MKKKKAIIISKRDVVWNYAGSILNIGMNLFILPIILTALPTSDLGVWYVFSSISGLVSLIDFGFSPSISRSVTCAWCGADEIKKEGLVTLSERLSPNYSLLKSLTKACEKIYLYMSLIAGIFLLSFGTFYINQISAESSRNQSFYTIAWIVYAFSIVLNLYYSYWSSLLKGIGAIKQNNIAIIVSRFIFIILSTAGLLLGWGLIATSISLLISGITLRILLKRLFLKEVGNSFMDSPPDEKNSPKDLFNQLLPSSSKYGIVSVGGFLSVKASVILCSYYLGLNITASYGLSLQILDLIGSLSQLLFHSYSPMITSAIMSNDRNNVVKLFSTTMVFQLIFGLAGIIGLSLFGDSLLKLIGSNARLLSLNAMIFLAVVMLFEWNTSMFLNFIMTSNYVPFAKATLISGVLIAVSTYILLIYTNMGVWSLILARAIVGLIYNNWYWPRYVFRKLETNFYSMFKIGITTLYEKIFIYCKARIKIIKDF